MTLWLVLTFTSDLICLQVTSCRPATTSPGSLTPIRILLRASPLTVTVKTPDPQLVTVRQVGLMKTWSITDSLPLCLTISCSLVTQQIPQIRWLISLELTPPTHLSLTSFLPSLWIPSLPVLWPSPSLSCLLLPNTSQAPTAVRAAAPATLPSTRPPHLSPSSMMSSCL